MALRELLPPDPALSSRRQARARRRRRNGPILAGVVVVAAAATGSLAALLTSDPAPSAGTKVAGYPSAAPSTVAPGSRAGAASAAAGSATGAAAEGAVADGDEQEVTVEPSTDASGALLMPRGVAYRGSAWPALTYTLKASSTGMLPAPFPRSVPGYRLADAFTTRLTVTENQRFAVFGDLPVVTASYDVCRKQRFFVRWQAVNPEAVVQSTFVDALVRTVQNRPVSGVSGWQSSYGCVQPALRIKPPAGTRPARTVVVAQMQVWVKR